MTQPTNQQGEQPLVCMNATTGDWTILDPNAVDTSAQDAIDRAAELNKSREQCDAQSATITQLDTALADRDREIKKLRDELNWQNKRNSGHPTRGGFEFYINEEWQGLANAAIDSDCSWHATLMKKRFDPNAEEAAVRGGECLPRCDSFAHEEFCPYCNPDACAFRFARQLERELNAANAEIALLRSNVLALRRINDSLHRSLADFTGNA